MKSQNKRIWEIDALRGIAIMMMILFHVLWGFNFAQIISFPQIHTGFWRGFAYTTATIFIFLVGVSLTLSYSKIKNKKVTPVWKYVKRGIKIFSYGLIITLISYIVFKEGFVYFGILHFIGTAIILSIPFLKFKNLNLILGFFILLIGIKTYNIILEAPGFILLGFRYYGMYTFDFFPILPWFGVVLLGLFAGKRFFPNGKRRIKVPENIPLKKQLSFLGRHSLLIYFLHIMAILLVIFIIKHI